MEKTVIISLTEESFNKLDKLVKSKGGDYYDWIAISMIHYLLDRKCYG